MSKKLQEKMHHFAFMLETGKLFPYVLLDQQQNCLTFGVEIKGKDTKYFKVLIFKLQLQEHCSDLKVYEYTSVLL